VAPVGPTRAFPNTRIFTRCVTIPLPGPPQPTSGAPPMRIMVGCNSNAGADCMQSHKSMTSGERDKLVPSSVAPSFVWRWNASPNRPKRRCRCGCGGGNRTHQIWQPSGASMLLGSPSNTPIASSSRCGSWTTPKLRSPEAADRWTWLVILAYVQLRLARPLVVDHRLPWKAPLPEGKITPARIRRAFSQLLPTLGRLASAPKPCGRSPGRPKGRR
jgi:hypothetical protein